MEQATTAIVLYPHPARGHLVSMVEFANHLLNHHPNSFSITVIIAPAPPFTAAPYIAAVSASTPAITFHHLPSLNSDNHASASPPPVFDSVRLHNPNLRHALLSIPNLRALVMDFFCSAASDVAAGLNIDTYFYFTSGASGLAPFLYLPTIHNTTIRSLIDLGDQIVHVPGLPPIPAADMPTGMIYRSSKIYGYFLETSARMARSAGIIVNTSRSLEQRAVTAIVTGKCVPDGPTPPVYCIGPLVTANADGGGDGAESRHECLSWLDSQPSQSVLYLSFGSAVSFPANQLKEMAVALERTGVRFLWVVRSPPPQDQTPRTIAKPAPDSELEFDSVMPEGFLERTRDRGLVVKSWAPQVAVLNHDSVGGFVTHCGWNSVLEAVCAGVPMLAWPVQAEQKVNRAFLVAEAKAALTVAESGGGGGFVSADELEKRVTELMNSDKGQAVRERVQALRECVAAALSEGGSSRVALAELAESLKQG